MEDIISVIMPVYNAEPYVEAAINSVLGQTYQHIELIIVEDQSTDGSRQICFSYAERDARIKIIQGEHNGVAAARNLGIQAATGDFITFVDADDMIDTDTYRLMQAIIDDKENTVYAFSVRNFYTENELLEAKRENKTKERNITGADTFEACIDLLLDKEKQIDFYLCNKLYPQKLFSKFAIDETLPICEDFVFNWNVFNHINRLKVLELPLYFYRHSNQSLTRALSMERYYICVQIYDFILKKYEMKISKNAKVILRARYMDFCLVVLEIMVLKNQYEYRMFIDIQKRIKQENIRDNRKIRIFQRIKLWSVQRSYKSFQFIYTVEKTIRKLLKKRSWYVLHGDTK